MLYIEYNFHRWFADVGPTLARRSKSRWPNVGPTDVPTLGQRRSDGGMLSGLEPVEKSPHSLFFSFGGGWGAGGGKSPQFATTVYIRCINVFNYIECISVNVLDYLVINILKHVIQ